MTKKIILGVAVACVLLVVGLCVIISLQPGTFSIQRSTVVDAPPAVVFAKLNDLEAWDQWSPWRALDPNPKTTLSNPSSGKGATFTWDGNAEIGAGSLTIVDSTPDKQVEVEQAFTRPIAGTALMTFTVAPQDGGTRLMWRIEGHNNFVAKAMCMLVDMDAMLGPSFEQGLENIKRLVESKDAATVH